MKRYLYLALALMILVAAIGAACDGGEPSEPEATATPTTGAETTTATATATATVAPASTATETPATPPTAPAEATPTIAADTTTAITPGTPADTPTAMAQATAETPTGYTPSDDPQAAIYEAMLASIPDTPRTREAVSIYDYTLVRQLFDIPLPGPEDSEDALEEYYDYVPPLGGWGDVFPAPGGIGLAFFDLFSRHSKQLTANFPHLAFDVRNIDQVVLAYAELLPEHEGTTLGRMEVVRGRFDPQATDAALRACSGCPAPSLEEHRSIPFYSWEEDYARNEQLEFAPPAFDQLGRGGHIAVMEEYLLYTLGTSEMQTLIDAHLNEAPSLADVEEFRLLAGGMSQLGAYFMILSDDAEAWEFDGFAERFLGEGASQEDIDKAQQLLTELGPRLRPYDAYATGAGKDEDGSYMALVLIHADDASAEENVGLLRRRIEEGSSAISSVPWSDSIDVDTLEIKAEGRLLLAKLRGFVRYWQGWWAQRDILILHE